MSTSRAAATRPTASGRHIAAGAIKTHAAWIAGFGLATAALFAGPLREFADESDNLVGGYLIAHGYRLYTDYFASHMPLQYYMAAVGALAGASSLLEFRWFGNLLMALAVLAISRSFRHRLPPGVMLTWAILTLTAHLVGWGEMLHAGTWAGVGVTLAGLLFYTTPRFAFGPRQMVALSLAVFIAVQSSLLTIYPLALLACCYVAARMAAARETGAWPEARGLAWRLGLIVAPHACLLLALALTGSLGDFVYDAYTFNQTYYARYQLNPSVLGMLHDLEASYRTYLASTLRQPFGVDGFLVLANVLAAGLTARRRGLVAGVLYYAFVVLTRIRAEGSYLLVSYFSAALSLHWAAVTLRRSGHFSVGDRQRGSGQTMGRMRQAGAGLAAVLAVLVLGSGLGFGRGVALRYVEQKPVPAFSPAVARVRALTEPGEAIQVLPYDPYIYLASQRWPATRFEFFFPWQADDPRSSQEFLSELQAARPPLVIFHRYEPVNARYLPIEYAQPVYEYLQRAYVPIDASDPELGDLFVLPERAATSRAALAEAGLLGQ